MAKIIMLGILIIANLFFIFVFVGAIIAMMINKKKNANIYEFIRQIEKE